MCQVTTIVNKGLVQTRTRILAKIACPMDLRLFPMDRQQCSIYIQSSAHPNNELTYVWSKKNQSELVFVQGLQFQDKVGWTFKAKLQIAILLRM